MRGQSSTSGASQREGLPVRHGTGEEDANTWHDGRPVLRGFHIASRQPGKEPW